MTILRLPVLAIAVLIGGWLIFDGSRALIVGDYVTPRSGSSAGQPGPWSHVISALGFEPRSTAIKCLHVVLGLLWLGAAFCFQRSPSSGWVALLITSVCSLWYLPVGTVLSVAEIALLFLPSIRSLR